MSLNGTQRDTSPKIGRWMTRLVAAGALAAALGLSGCAIGEGTTTLLADAAEPVAVATDDAATSDTSTIAQFVSEAAPADAAQNVEETLSDEIPAEEAPAPTPTPSATPTPPPIPDAADAGAPDTEAPDTGAADDAPPAQNDTPPPAAPPAAPPSNNNDQNNRDQNTGNDQNDTAPPPAPPEENVDDNEDDQTPPPVEREDSYRTLAYGEQRGREEFDLSPGRNTFEVLVEQPGHLSFEVRSRGCSRRDPPIAAKLHADDKLVFSELICSIPSAAGPYPAGTTLQFVIENVEEREVEVSWSPLPTAEKDGDAPQNPRPLVFETFSGNVRAADRLSLRNDPVDAFRISGDDPFFKTQPSRLITLGCTSIDESPVILVEVFADSKRVDETKVHCTPYGVIGQRVPIQLDSNGVKNLDIVFTAVTEGEIVYGMTVPAGN